MSLSKILVLTVVLALVFSACAKKEGPPVKEKVQPTEQVTPPPLEEVTKPAPAPVVKEEKPEEIVLEDVFFDFDKYDIKDQYKKVLANDAEVLLKHNDLKVVIEGHCDERGTNEYNLALGEKRAKAVMDFLIAYGVSPSNITIISYGEERPFDPGHNEAAWAKNRRAHFVIKK